MSDSSEWQIAKVRSTSLGWEDHGIFTAVLFLDYGSSGQGAGTYRLDKPSSDAGEPSEGTAFGLEWIMRVMEACGVQQWENLPGRTVYARADHAHVYAIKPLPTEGGREFDFAALAAKYSEKTA